MVQIGCCARFFNKYEDEVKFAIDNGIDFMQLWYDKDGLGLHKNNEPKVNLIKEHGFPTIIHAVLDINEIEEHIPILVDHAEFLGHKELIIHPICISEQITNETIYKLSDKISNALDVLKKHNITLYLENNSLKSPIFTSRRELEIMFSKNNDLESLLDIAHIQSYEHLCDLVAVKYPRILHIADKHFDVIHEHLPIGQGELDYNHIFNIIKDFNGKIIVEVVDSDKDIINAVEYIRQL
jgi:sugar phosphate isomerase/epimerase